MDIILFLKQLFVMVSPQFAALAVGGTISYPGVLLRQVANATAAPLDIHTASWIGSIHGLAAIPAVLVPTLMQWSGRKFMFLAACLCNITGWLLAYTASSVSTILVSECFHGFSTQSLMTVTMLTLSEMVAPKFRNISMVAFFLCQSLGISAVGISGRYIHWKTISLIMGSFTTISFLSALLWPQSPYWLAYKDKYDECKEAFVWLRGTDDEATKELDELIATQRINKKSIKKSQSYTVQSAWQMIKSRDFYVPCVLTFILINLMYWSGTVVVLIYGRDLILQATLNEDLATLGYILVNLSLFVGITSTNVLIKFFNNKSVLMVSTVGSAVFLLSISILTFLQSLGKMLASSPWFMYFLVAYMIFNSLGINSVVFSLAAELMPVKHRGAGGALYIVSGSVLHAASLKAAPYMFRYVGLAGSFLIYCCNVVVCGALVWKFVPETKGRTLQEIEQYYCHMRFEQRISSRDDTTVMIK